MELLELLSFHMGGGRAENKAEYHMICKYSKIKKKKMSEVSNHELLAA